MKSYFCFHCDAKDFRIRNLMSRRSSGSISTSFRSIWRNWSWVFWSQAEKFFFGRWRFAKFAFSAFRRRWWLVDRLVSWHDSCIKTTKTYVLNTVGTFFVVSLNMQFLSWSPYISLKSLVIGFLKRLAKMCSTERKDAI